MMKGLSYSIWQGWRVFWKERRKFYFVALEVTLAVALLSVLLHHAVFDTAAKELAAVII